MPPIPITCQECGHSAELPEKFAGKRVRCLRCQTKLRVPTAAPQDDEGRRGDRRRRGRRRNTTRSRTRAMISAPSETSPESETRARAADSIREILEDYEYEIHNDERGFQVDLRGVTFGLARTLVEEVLEDAPGVRDVRLSGGLGECRISVILKGAVFNPDDSFADEQEETEVYYRKPLSERLLADDALIPGDEGGRSDPVDRMMADADAAGDPPASEAEVSRGSSSEGDEAPDLDAWVEQGQDLLEAGEPEKAVAILERAVRRDREHQDAIYVLATAYAAAGDYERARRAYRRFARLCPDDADGHVMHAAASVACDRLEEARAAIVKAIRLDPQHAKAYRYAARLYDRLGDPIKAKQFRKRYRELKPR